MDQEARPVKSLLWKRRLERVDKGIYKYWEKDGTEKFAVRIKHKDKDHRKFGFPTVTKAREWRKSRLGRIVEGRLFPEQELAEEARTRRMIPSFRVYAEGWLRGCRAKFLKRSTIRRYEGILRKHLYPAFGHLQFSEISRARVREMAVATSETGLEPKTVHNIVRTLSAIFSQAIEEGVVINNPAGKPSMLVKRRRVGERVEAFTEGEEISILATAYACFPSYYAFILTLFRTGLRFGEAVALMPKDLDFRQRYAVVERNFTQGFLEDSTKGGRRREIDLSRDLVPVLKDHLAVRGAEEALPGGSRCEWLFTSVQGEILRSNNFRGRVWKPLLQKAGVRYRCVHTARHTYATRLIMRGASPVYVQRQLGHTSIQITVDLYAHWIRLTERERRLEVDRLAELPLDAESGSSSGTGPTSHAEMAKK